MRFAVEFFREPDQHIGYEALGWMTRGQLLCLPMIALGIFLLVFAYRGAGASGVSRPRQAGGNK
jgi:phosphatidylglycerol:prolipoprotein diacylglycerol transferase